MSADRFSELLPWYVNGSISDEDRAWVDGYLKDHPDARSELSFYQSLQKRMRENAYAASAPRTHAACASRAGRSVPATSVFMGEDLCPHYAAAAKSVGKMSPDRACRA
mgnify:CR=1 FL=1